MKVLIHYFPKLQIKISFNMHTDPIVFHIFVIFTGSAILATLALYARQALLVGYIVLGVIVGPSGFAIVKDTSIISGIAQIGIIFL